MRTKADDILAGLNEQGILPFDPEDIKRAFERKLEQFDFDNVRVSDVDIDLEGDIVVSFEDFEGDEVSLLFQYDDEDKAILAFVLEDEDDEVGDEVLLVDLTALNPVVLDMDSLGVKYVNLTDLTWMNKSTMTSLLQAGEVGVDDDVQPAQKKQDAFGNMMTVDLGVLESAEEETELSERSAVVVRGGKRVKLPVVRRRRKKRLSAAQKAGIRKAAMKRKSKQSQINRNRKKSTKLRSRLKLKKAASGSRKKFKVGR